LPFHHHDLCYKKRKIARQSQCTAKEMINLKWLSKIQGTRGIFANSKRSYGKITIQILHFLQRAFEIQAIQTKSEATMNAGKKGKKKEVMF
jgi:hypothetical protein